MRSYDDRLHVASAYSSLNRLHQVAPDSFKAVNLDDEDDDEEVETKAEPETGSEPLQSEAQSLEWIHSAPTFDFQ